MGKVEHFNRCIYCFEKKTAPGSCPVCGYDNGLCDPPGWWLSPGTVLKGHYVVGKHIASTPTEITYLGWDIWMNHDVEVVEYFPEAWVKRDITDSETVSSIPGCEAQIEAGRQAFFEKAKLFYRCVSRVEELTMDFFVRNNTCYYVRRKNKKKGTSEADARK